MALVDIGKKDGKYYIIETVRKMINCTGIYGVFEEYYMDIDEMIALPMIAFLKKGYITEMSCSGHSQYSLSSCYSSECDNKEESIFSIEEDDDVEYFFLNQDYGNKKFLISFKEDYFKGVVLPDGWKYGVNDSMINVVYDLYYEIGEKIDNELFLTQVQLSQQLLQWIDKLPSVIQ